MKYAHRSAPYLVDARRRRDTDPARWEGAKALLVVVGWCVLVAICDEPLGQLCDWLLR